MKKLIISDIDGTLVRDDKTISENTQKAIFKRINEGHEFAIATGRMHGAGRIITRMLDYNGYLISCNGAVVKHLKTGEVIQAIALEPQLVKAVVDICRAHDAYFHLYDIDDIYAEKHMHLAQKYFEGMEKLPEAYRFGVHFVEDVLAVDIPVYKVGLYSEQAEAFEAVMAEINRLEGVQTCKSLETSFDVMAKGVTKAKGIEAIANHFNIPREHVIAFGDNENDTEMIEYAGIGVAMANATEPLKAVADFITLSNESDGLVYALDRFVK